MKPTTTHPHDSHRTAIVNAEKRLKALNAEREDLKLFIESGKRLLSAFPKEAAPEEPTRAPSQEFASLSLVDASAFYLRTIGHPQTTEDLTAGVLGLGYKTTSKNLSVLLRPTLYKHIRRAKAEGKTPALIRVNGERWGLPGWEHKKGEKGRATP